MDGLALWAAYPTSGVDLSNSELAVVSIVGTEDGLVSRQQIEDSRSQLPPSTQFVFIEGGNHAQFGSYGIQDGDGPATVSAEEQWRQTASATIDFLQTHFTYPQTAVTEHLFCFPASRYLYQTDSPLHPMTTHSNCGNMPIPIT